MTRSKAPVSEVIQVGSASQAFEGQSGVEKRRAVVLIGVIFVAFVLPQLAEFNRIDSFVVVHRPPV